MKTAKSPRLSAELCLISLCDPALTEGLDELRARVSRLEYDLKNMPAGAGYAADDDDEDDAPLPEIPYDEPRPERSCGFDPEDELDPAQFAEYQPEDDLLDKPAADLNPDAPATVMPGDAGCEELWAATLDKAESSLPVGLMPILSDPAQVRCEFTDDTMTLFVVPGFSYNFINNNDILMRLRSAAAEVTGRSLKIRLCEDNGDGKTVRSLDELAQFAETRFI